MFTGIIERAGKVAGIRTGPAGARIEIEAGPVAGEVRIGDSVAVNGVCLTTVEIAGERLAFDAVNETLRRTNLGELSAGEKVNLERPLRAGGRLDGHIVQGHVDGTGTVESIREEGSSRRIRVRVPAGLSRYIVEKGSVALDGISLTVAAASAPAAPEAWFEVVIIPHTWEQTNLSGKAPGATVNLEVDILAKYVERLLAGR